MSEFDLVVRAGTVVDGTGGPARRADVAVVDGRVAEVGRVARLPPPISVAGPPRAGPSRWRLPPGIRGRLPFPWTPENLW